MDVRILNTCNSDCIYCLEQGLRKKQKYIDTASICSDLDTQRNSCPEDVVLGIYGGNPLLHPELKSIIVYAKKVGFESISLLTNTYGLDTTKLKSLQQAGLGSIGVYFHSFDEDIHNTVTQSGISLTQLLENIHIVTSQGLQTKIVVHVNKQNIDTIVQDTFTLMQKYNISSFEYVNYHAVSRAKKLYHDMLEYNRDGGLSQIKLLLQIAKKYDIDMSFKKFH